MRQKYKTYVDPRVDILRQEERLYFFKGTPFNVLVKLDRSRGSSSRQGRKLNI